MRTSGSAILPVAEPQKQQEQNPLTVADIEGVKVNALDDAVPQATTAAPALTPVDLFGRSSPAVVRVIVRDKQFAVTAQGYDC